MVFWGAARAAADAAGSELSAYNGGGWGQLRGYVAAEPVNQQDRALLTVRVEQVELEGLAPRSVSGRVRLETERYPAYRYGDRHPFSGRLQDTETTASDSYRQHLARRDIFSLNRYPATARLPGQQGYWIRRSLLSWRESARLVVNRVLPDPEAAMLNGILPGYCRSNINMCEYTSLKCSNNHNTDRR